jgi:hypothetical protein
MEDDLLSEYDLKSLRIRKLGSGQKSFGGTTVRLELDVAEMFSRTLLNQDQRISYKNSVRTQFTTSC